MSALLWPIPDPSPIPSRLPSPVPRLPRSFSGHTLSRHCHRGTDPWPQSQVAVLFPQEPGADAVLDHSHQCGGCHVLRTPLPSCRQLPEEVQPPSVTQRCHPPLPGTLPYLLSTWCLGASGALEWGRPRLTILEAAAYDVAVHRTGDRGPWRLKSSQLTQTQGALFIQRKGHLFRNLAQRHCLCQSNPNRAPLAPRRSRCGPTRPS